MATLVMIPAADQIEIDRDPQLNVGFGIVGCASNDDVKHGRRCPCRLSCTYEDVLSPLRLVPPVDQVFVFYGAGLEFMIALELPNAVKRHGELAQLLPPTELFSDRSTTPFRHSHYEETCSCMVQVAQTRLNQNSRLPKQ